MGRAVSQANILISHPAQCSIPQSCFHVPLDRATDPSSCLCLQIKWQLRDLGHLGAHRWEIFNSSVAEAELGQHSDVG